MSSFALGVSAEFRAAHKLVGGDFGPESELHSHDYRVEVVLEGDELDRHGFLVDIVELRSHLKALVDRFTSDTLNELSEFRGLNPGCEVFSRVFACALAERLDVGGLDALTVKIWESPDAWAHHRIEWKSE